MRHKYADMIIEWAETGREVQIATIRGWIDCKRPCWNPMHTFRFKPKTLKYKRYIAVCSLGFERVFNAHGDSPFSDPSTRPNFIRWIDEDWKEEIL